MSNKLILVVGGDQLAADMLKVGVGSYISSNPEDTVQVIRVGDDAEMAQEIIGYSYARHRGAREGEQAENDWYSPPRTAEYYVSKLATYASKVSRELPEGEWEAAGIWWFLGLSDARMFSAYRPTGADAATVAGIQSAIAGLLAWNPFGSGHSPKSYIALVPTFPGDYIPPVTWGAYNGSALLHGTYLSNVNTAISGAVAGSSGVGVSIAAPPSITGWGSGGLRKVEQTKDYGLSTEGARAYAAAFGKATADNLDIEEGDGTAVVEQVTTIEYTEHTDTRTRKKLSGLEGKTVTALVDGVEYRDITVSADGTLTLPQGVSGDKITIGFPYHSVLAPMPIDTDGQGGTTLGRRRAYGKCVLRLFRSKGGQYGASTANDLYDQRAWEQGRAEPNLMNLYDIPYALYRDDAYPFSGDVEFTLPSGQDADTTIWCVTDTAYPMRIVSIVADVDFGEA